MPCTYTVKNEAIEVIIFMNNRTPCLFSSEKLSFEYLEVNSCGIEHISTCDRGSERKNGRSDYHILYVQRGVCHVFLEGGWQQVDEGGVILFRPHEPQIYRYFRRDNSVSHYVHFSGVGCESILKRLGLYEVKIFTMGRSASFEECSEKLAREFAMQRVLCKDFCAAYLYELLNIVARKRALRQDSINARSESRINKACSKIFESISSPPSAAELAAEFHISESRFLHLFREVTGLSMTEFIATIRISRAKSLLADTDLAVGEIAESVGYEDQNYFSRLFRKLEGCSPRAYREKTSS